MLKPMSNPSPVAALVTGLNDMASIWWRSSQKRASRMSSPNERPGFFSTCTMKGESAMVALLSYALRREQRALSWCRVSEEGTNIVRYRTIIRMTRGFLGIRQIPARMAAVFRAIGARYRESRLVVTVPAAKLADWPPRSAETHCLACIRALRSAPHHPPGFRRLAVVQISLEIGQAHFLLRLDPYR